MSSVWADGEFEMIEGGVLRCCYCFYPRCRRRVEGSFEAASETT